jgi:DNA-binding XRE family transcriptional regulator
MTITGEQCKAARKLLKWSKLQLGHKAGVSDATIESFEVSRYPLRPKNVRAIRHSLEAAGIEFCDKGHGVRMREGKP